MTDIVLSLVVLAAVGLAVRYIYKAHKSGVKCVGCPASGCCASAAKGGCGAKQVKNK